MGLSASQAKLLSITSRLSANELRAENITREKTRLSDQIIDANDTYLDALNATQLTYYTYDQNGNETYTTLTGSVLYSYSSLKNQYALISSSGRILVSETDAENYENSNNLEEFLEKYGVVKTGTGEYETVPNPDYQDEYKAWLAEGHSEEEEFVTETAETIEQEIYEYNDQEKAQWYSNLYNRMSGITDSGASAAGGCQYEVLLDGLMNSAEWLQYALENGSVTLEQVSSSDTENEETGLLDATWTSIIYTSALDISETSDDSEVAQAEAEFENIQKVLEAKDKQLDNMLKLLDTEHSALETEYESAKSVIEKNVDRTLKIYSA